MAALAWLAGQALLPAQATTLARMDVAQLTAHSSAVARVRCISSVYRREPSGVWTVTTFEVADVWKGSLPATVSVRLPGGRAGGQVVRVDGAPRFVPGEEAVLFLEPARHAEMTITSWAQGTFRIRRPRFSELEEATQDTAGLHLLDSGTGRAAAGGVARIALARLRAEVASAARRQP
jgi:hypothetical protein